MKTTLLLLLIVCTTSVFSQNCVIYGTIQNPLASPDSGEFVRVHKVLKNGTLISLKPLAVKSNAAGYFSFQLPKGSVAYISALIPGYEKNLGTGTAVAIPNTDSALLSSLVTVTIPSAFPVAMIPDTTSIAGLIADSLFEVYNGTRKLPWVLVDTPLYLGKGGVGNAGSWPDSITVNSTKYPSMTLAATAPVRLSSSSGTFTYALGGDDSVRLSPTQRDISQGAKDSTTIGGTKSNAFTLQTPLRMSGSQISWGGDDSLRITAVQKARTDTSIAAGDLITITNQGTIKKIGSDTSGFFGRYGGVTSESDPLAVKKADSASYSLGYVTKKSQTDTLNAGVVRAESDPLAVKKADSSSYSIGYVTKKSQTDTLNANVVRSESDPLAVKKADSASYSLGYVTKKSQTDTLNANVVRTESDPVYAAAASGLRLKSDTTKPAGTVTWTQARIEVKDSLDKLFTDTTGRDLAVQNISATGGTNAQVLTNIGGANVAWRDGGVPDSVLQNWYRVTGTNWLRPVVKGGTDVVAVDTATAKLLTIATGKADSLVTIKSFIDTLTAGDPALQIVDSMDVEWVGVTRYKAGNASSAPGTYPRMMRRKIHVRFQPRIANSDYICIVSDSVNGWNIGALKIEFYTSTESGQINKTGHLASGLTISYYGHDYPGFAEFWAKYVTTARGGGSNARNWFHLQNDNGAPKGQLWPRGYQIALYRWGGGGNLRNQWWCEAEITVEANVGSPESSWYVKFVDNY